MRRLTLLSGLALALLAACSRGLPPVDPSLQTHMENPLFAQAYYSDLVDHFVNLQIHNDPIFANAATKRQIDAARTDALKKAQAASRLVSSGSLASFAPIQEESKGNALALGSMLYFGTDFYTVPGGDLRVYVSNAVDPRGAPFPDPTAVEVGKLKNPYGPQSYSLPAGRDAKEHPNQTVVLWDAMLKRMHGFAQLRS